MPTTEGLERLFGEGTQDRINELKRQCLVALSEAVEEPIASPAFPRTITVVRRQQTVAGVPSQGIDAIFVDVAGLTDIVAHVKTHGRWRREGEDRASDLREGERIVLVADIPATGAGDDAVLFSTLTMDDRIRYDDPVYGVSTFTVLQIRARPAAGIVAALISYGEARED